jgi:hypothetical protein
MSVHCEPVAERLVHAYWKDELDLWSPLPSWIPDPTFKHYGGKRVLASISPKVSSRRDTNPRRRHRMSKELELRKFLGVVHTAKNIQRTGACPPEFNSAEKDEFQAIARSTRSKLQYMRRHRKKFVDTSNNNNNPDSPGPIPLAKSSAASSEGIMVDTGALDAAQGEIAKLKQLLADAASRYDTLLQQQQQDAQQKVTRMKEEGEAVAEKDTELQGLKLELERSIAENKSLQSQLQQRDNQLDERTKAHEQERRQWQSQVTATELKLQESLEQVKKHEESMEALQVSLATAKKEAQDQTTVHEANLKKARLEAEDLLQKALTEAKSQQQTEIAAYQEQVQTLEAMVEALRAEQASQEQKEADQAQAAETDEMEAKEETLPDGAKEEEEEGKEGEHSEREKEKEKEKEETGTVVETPVVGAHENAVALQNDLKRQLKANVEVLRCQSEELHHLTLENATLLHRIAQLESENETYGEQVGIQLPEMKQQLDKSSQMIDALIDQFSQTMKEKSHPVSPSLSLAGKSMDSRQAKVPRPSLAIRRLRVAGERERERDKDKDEKKGDMVSVVFPPLVPKSRFPPEQARDAQNRRAGSPFQQAVTVMQQSIQAELEADQRLFLQQAAAVAIENRCLLTTCRRMVAHVSGRDRGKEASDKAEKAAWSPLSVASLTLWESSTQTEALQPDAQTEGLQQRLSHCETALVVCRRALAESERQREVWEKALRVKENENENENENEKEKEDQENDRDPEGEKEKPLARAVASSLVRLLRNQRSSEKEMEMSRRVMPHPPTESAPSHPSRRKCR